MPPTARFPSRTTPISGKDGDGDGDGDGNSDDYRDCDVTMVNCSDKLNFHPKRLHLQKYC
jgi:hypothetical protein